MDISRRQKKALDMLLTGYRELTITQIASALQVSGRTIHRELARIAPLLSERYGLVLSGRAGHGLRIIGDEASMQRCLEDISDHVQDDLLPEERRRVLALRLVSSNEVVKLFSLTMELEAATQAVRADLATLEAWFANFRLRLILRRGLGVVVEGDEADRRQALCSLIMEHYGEAGIVGLVSAGLEVVANMAPRMRGSSHADVPARHLGSTPAGDAEPFGHYLAEVFDLGDLTLIAGLLEDDFRMRLPDLAPRDYLGLVVHLALARGRNARGRLLDEGVGTGASIGSRSGLGTEASGTGSTGTVSPVDRALVADLVAVVLGQGRPGSIDSGTTRGAESLGRSDSAVGPGPLGTGAGPRGGGAGAAGCPPLSDWSQKAEEEALARYLLGAKPGTTSVSKSDFGGIGSLPQVVELIQNCSRTSGHDFSTDRVLREGLAAHWGPAYYRIRNHLPIENPILAQIRDGYPELFDAVARAAAWTFPELRVPDDEIGFLVLHFGSSLERDGTRRLRFRALVVCSAGIGSAHMLASRIRSELPEIDIVANLSWFDVKDRVTDSWDIIVSTIPLPLDPGSYLMVSPLLEPHEAARIRAALGQRTEQIRNREVVRPAEPEEPSLAGLRSVHRHLEAVIGILELLQVFEVPYQDVLPDWEATLGAMVERCTAAGLVHTPAHCQADLELRSRDHGILLPDSRVLFLHARTSGVTNPSLSIHVHSRGIACPNAGWHTNPTRVVLLLAPQHIGAEVQDILNEISVSLLDARTIEVLHEADANTIRAHYTRYLDRFFRSIPRPGADRE